MKAENDAIWKVGAFDHKRHRLRVVAGSRNYRWRSIVARVDTILTDRNRLILVIRAIGNDPRNPSLEDSTNAQLSALVVSKQLRWRLSTKKLRVYLCYETRTQVEVVANIAATERTVDDYLSNARPSEYSDVLPSPLLAYLLSKSHLNVNR